MRSPRRVTLAPMALPSRSLKPAIDFLARVTSGFWPVMTVRSATAPSSSDGWPTASPTPMFTTIFVEAGHLHDVAEAELVLELAADLLVVPGLEPGHGRRGVGRGVAHSSAPVRLQIRIFEPSALTL